jgi:GH25 family lysozyme M1 (1,4-beta-N-acetylmuramidase)
MNRRFGETRFAHAADIENSMVLPSPSASADPFQDYVRCARDGLRGAGVHRETARLGYFCDAEGIYVWPLSEGALRDAAVLRRLGRADELARQMLRMFARRSPMQWHRNISSDRVRLPPPEELTYEISQRSSKADQVRHLLRSGRPDLAVSEAFAHGLADVNQLTNMVFYARHPQLGGRSILPHERALAREWMRIRNSVVRPAIARLAPAAQPAATTSSSAVAVASVPTFLGLDTFGLDGNKVRDWKRAKAEGQMSFAIFRSNYGSFTDTAFVREWPKIRDAGMVRGAYMFLRFPHPEVDAKFGPCPSPDAQAKAFIKTVGKLDRRDLPPSLDVEFPGGRRKTGMSPQQCLEHVRAAWRTLRTFYGVAPIIYTSARVWHEDLDDLPVPDLLESPLWLAFYPFKKGEARRDAAVTRRDPPVPPAWGDRTNWWIHQYQGDALRLPGFVTGNVDLNRFHGMNRGAVGDQVKWVQRRLGLAQSGKFDAMMVTAVRKFQRNSGLPETPVIDPQTFALLCWSNP